jgi:hypothetical protein
MRNLTRARAIEELRAALLTLVDDDHSFCEVAAREGIVCRGFRQFTDEELRERYEWIVRKHPSASRTELEKLANQWQLARQFVQNQSFACDVQAREHDTCGGWDDISNTMLIEALRKLRGEEVEIVSAKG